MAIVTGTLTDFGLQALTSLSPRIIFTASEPATLSGRLFATVPIVVTPSATGTFSVDLQPTDFVTPGVFYRVRVEWLDAAGGYVGVDLLDWPLYVPAGGGAIGDLVQVDANPALAWVGVDPPPQLPVRTVWWLQVNPDDPDDPRATGILYEWG